MSVRRYVVVENTPGYVPDDDDPFVTDDLGAAKIALVDAVDRLCEFHEETEETYERWVSDDGMSAYVVEERPHALGRVFEILPVDDEG